MSNFQNAKRKAFFFQKFTRKKFSVFNSLRKVIHISNLTLVYTLIVAPATSIAQDDSVSVVQTYELDEVEIVGQLASSELQDIPRLVSVLNATEIKHSPSLSLTDLLGYSANVDIRQRGKAGIQSDISIRGGSFDHNLILLNGINISDPQTGHLSLNLPVEKQAIKRIEVLNGSAARVHGANAIAGVVNFVTQPSDVNSLYLESSYGNFGFFSNSVTLNVATKNAKNLLHYNNAFSDGYVPNTDFERQSVFYHGKVFTPDGILDVQMGYADRAFGSNGFYTPKFPDQYEQNQMSYFAVGYKTGRKIKVHPQVYWRRHRDRWEMFRVGEDWYRVENGQSISNNTPSTTYDTMFVYTNHHINDVAGAKISMSTNTILGTSTIGFHVRNEGIISNSIGDSLATPIPVRAYDGVYYTLSSSRSSFDMHYEQKYENEKLKLAVGLLANWNSFQPEEINIFPGIDLNYEFIQGLSVLGSYNYTLGYPTFIDLLYSDHNNLGNNSLKTYSLHSFEGGLQWITGISAISSTYFYIQGTDVIDWVWFEDINKFQPINVSGYLSQGLELSVQTDLRNVPVAGVIFDNVRANYTYIDVNKDMDGNFAKYSNIRQKFSAMLSKDIVKDLNVSVNINYTEREGSYRTYNFDIDEYENHSFKPYFLIDAHVSYTFNGFTFYVEATNLLGSEYIDIGSIYQPGRWIIGGIKYELTGF